MHGACKTKPRLRYKMGHLNRFRGSDSGQICETSKVTSELNGCHYMPGIKKLENKYGRLGNALKCRHEF
jgi:hypothetical protein